MFLLFRRRLVTALHRGAMLVLPAPLAAPLAAPLPVALRVEAPPELGCLPAEALAKRVDAACGAAVISPTAARRLVVVYAPTGSGLSAEMTLNEGDEVLGRRRVESAGASCAALDEAVVLAISILATPPPEVPVPPPPAVPDPPPPPTPEPAPRLALVAGLHGSAGDTPGPALALALGGEIGFGWGRTGLEARVDLPGLGKGALAGGQASVWRGLALASVCLESGPLAGCAQVGGGAQRASGSGFETNRARWLQALGAGLAGTWDFTTLGPAVLRLEAGAWVPIGETRLRTTDERAWTAWPVAPRLGLGARFH